MTDGKQNFQLKQNKAGPRGKVVWILWNATTSYAASMNQQMILLVPPYPGSEKQESIVCEWPL